MKASLVVTYPVRCPALPGPQASPSLLAAKGQLAGLLIDIDGFLRADIGIAEAAALLGRPVLCSQSPASGYLDLHLAPRDPNAHQVTLETHDGDLIGIVVEYERTVAVDVTQLEARFGAPRRHVGHFESRLAESESFPAENASFRAQLGFDRSNHRDPPTARQVYQIIFRRTPMVEIMPERFDSAADVARLVALALRVQAPEAVAFAGTLGLYQPPERQRITFANDVPARNVKTAVAGLRSVDGRDFVRRLDVAFAAPIPGGAEGLARALGTAFGIPTPAVAVEGARRRIDVVDGGKRRGKVVLDVVGEGIRAIVIERVD